MLKQTLIASAALALAAVPAFAYYNGAYGGSYTQTNDSHNTITKTYTKTVTVNKADISNDATVNNMVFTAANSGLNSSTANGGDTKSVTVAKSGSVSGDTTGGAGVNGSTGGAATGGNMSGNAGAGSLTAGGDTNSTITTGDAGAQSTVANVVNTTVVHF